MHITQIQINRDVNVTHYTYRLDRRVISKHKTADAVAGLYIGRLAREGHLNGSRAPGNEGRQLLLLDIGKALLDLVGVNMGGTGNQKLKIASYLRGIHFALNDIECRDIAALLH